MTTDYSDRWALDQLIIACKNIGYDLTCGACASLFFTGAAPYSHQHGKDCKTVAPPSKPDTIKGPVPMLLWCPGCGARHLDVGEFAEKAHTTHACQTCGMVWKPALVPTVGVQYLPGYKNEPTGK